MRGMSLDDKRLLAHVPQSHALTHASLLGSHRAATERGEHERYGSPRHAAGSRLCVCLRMCWRVCVLVGVRVYVCVHLNGRSCTPSSF